MICMPIQKILCPPIINNARSLKYICIHFFFGMRQNARGPPKGLHGNPQDVASHSDVKRSALELFQKIVGNNI